MRIQAVGSGCGTKMVQGGRERLRGSEIAVTQKGLRVFVRQKQASMPVLGRIGCVSGRKIVWIPQIDPN